MKSAHGLKIDGRKSMTTNIEENGIKKKVTKGSGRIKIREMMLKKAKANNDHEKVQKLEMELKEIYNQIEK